MGRNQNKKSNGAAAVKTPAETSTTSSVDGIGNANGKKYPVVSANGGTKSGPKRRSPLAPAVPNETIVVKNLDFNLDPSDLEVVLRGLSGGKLAYKSCHFQKDANGKFKGLAFVTFDTVEEAKEAMKELMPLVLNGRKLFIEFRRPTRAENIRKDGDGKRGFQNSSKRFEAPPRATFERDLDHSTPMLDENGNALDKRAAFFKRYTEERGEARYNLGEARYNQGGKHAAVRTEFNTPEWEEFEKKYRAMLTGYRDREVEEGEEISDFQFSEDLDSRQRLVIHRLCDQLGLAHISRNVEEPDVHTENGEPSSNGVSNSDAKAVKIKRMIVVSKDPAKRAAFKEESVLQRKLQKEAKAKKRKELVEKKKVVREPLTEEEYTKIKWFKPRAQKAAEGSEKPANEIQKPSYRIYTPPRQPCGPDGTIGFGSRKSRHAIASEESESTETTDEDSTQEKETKVSEKETKVSRRKKPSSKSGKTVKLDPTVAPFEPSTVQD